MSKSLKVLITGAGTVACPSVIKGFRQQSEIQVHITAVGPNLQPAGRYLADAFHAVPPASDTSFIPTLRDIVKHEGIQLLIPVVDDEFPVLAESREQFEHSGCRVAVSDPRIVALCREKDKTYGFFKQNGIPTMSSWVPADLPYPGAVRYPVFVKPRTGKSSGGHKISNAQEFYFWTERTHEPIYREFLEGEDHTVDVFSNFYGRAICAIACVPTETNAAGACPVRTVCDSKLTDASKFIAEKAGIVGPSNFRCIKTSAGLIFTEMNQGFSENLPLVIAAGLNPLLLLAKCTLFEDVRGDGDDFEDGLVMLRFWDEIFVSRSGEVRMDTGRRR